jgi:DNA-binding NtrC family response regulator
VRELKNVVERAFVLSGGRGIDHVHLPSSTMQPKKIGLPTTPDASEPPVTDLGPEELAERKRILSALAECGGNQSSAAALLGFSRSTLLNRLDAYRIRRPRKRPH